MTRKSGSIYVQLAIILSLTLASGALVGMVTQRWGMSDSAQQAAERLPAIPEIVGDWEMVASDEATKRVIETLRLAGYVHRTYQHRRSGEIVEAYLVLGPAGPISVHQPEICFRNAAFSQRGDRVVTTIGDGDRFWTLAFDPSETNLDGGLVRVYYAWSDGEAWEAPADARFAMAGNSHLYKLQVTSHLPVGFNLERDDPCQSFLADFVPAVEDHLVPARSLAF